MRLTINKLQLKVYQNKNVCYHVLEKDFRSAILALKKPTKVVIPNKEYKMKSSTVLTLLQIKTLIPSNSDLSSHHFQVK